MRRLLLPLIPLVLAATPGSALAADDGFEFWLNPSVSVGLDEDTGIELETAQRLRDAGDGRADTYFARLWINRDLADNVTLSGAIERRANDGGNDETRLIQQLSTSHGVLRTRLRLEQRFVENGDRMGLRLRPRLGVKMPLGEDSRWAIKSDAELFFTLRSTRPGGDEGLTGLRTQLGVDYEVSNRLTLNAAYLRQQDIAEGGPDQVGHAPIIGIEFAL